MSGTGARRTVVLGFDALDFRYLDEFRDTLPNFGALRSEGTEAPLRSTFPPWTGSAWPSMYTGTDPSYHNAYTFFQYGSEYPDEAEHVSRTHVERPAIWNYLDSLDRPSIVLNVPVTHPADPIEGVLIPGYLAKESDEGNREGIREELSAALGEEYRIYAETEMSSDKEAKFEGMVGMIDLRARAAKHLLSNYDWEVAVIQVQKTDAVFHNFTDTEKFRRIYETADDLVGTVRDTAPDANVVVCSDHGMGPITGYKIFVNEVLRQHGFIETTDESAMPSLEDTKSDLVEADGSAGGSDGRDDAGPGLVDRAALTLSSSLSAVGITPATVYGAAQKVGLGSALRRAVPNSLISSVGEDIDWRRSKAYARTMSELGVRVNLEGREPNGVVSEEEYEAVRDEIIDVLSNLHTPDGEPAFEFVVRREEIYDGPYAENACDVLFMPTDMNHMVLTGLFGKRFLPVDLYNHMQDGVFIGAGPAFDATVELDTLSLTDVAPIVFGSMGLDVPEGMTGTIPDGLLAEPVGRAEYPDVTFGTRDGREGEDDETTERLKDLGYL